MHKVAICDDYQGYIRNLEKRIARLGVGNLEVCSYTSGRQLLRDLDRMHDIIILDIQLGDSDGKEVAKKIRKVNKNAVLVLCSGVEQPTPEAFVVNAYRYIIKSDPDEVTDRVLKETFEEADRRFAQKCMLADVDDTQVRVNIKDIMYISKLKYGSEIHMDPGEPFFQGKQVTVKRHLTELYESMKDYGFEYAHNSYIVNCRWVSDTQKDCLRLLNGEILNVSRNKRKQFMERMAGSLAEKYH